MRQPIDFLFKRHLKFIQSKSSPCFIYENTSEGVKQLNLKKTLNEALTDSLSVFGLMIKGFNQLASCCQKES